MNLYAYVHNNPFQYIDPDGLFVFALPLVQVAFGVAVNEVFLSALKYAVVVPWMDFSPKVDVETTLLDDSDLFISLIEKLFLSEIFVNIEGIMFSMVHMVGGGILDYE